MRKAKREVLSVALLEARRVILKAWKESLHNKPKLNSRKGLKTRKLFFAEMDTFFDSFVKVLEKRDRTDCEGSLKRMASLFFQVGIPHTLLTHAQMKLKRITIDQVIERFEGRKNDIRMMCDLIESEIDNNRIYLSDEFERLALQTLEVSERNYRELIEEMEDLVIRITISGKIIFANSASVTFFGIPRERIAGTALEDFIDVSDRKNLRKVQREVCQTYRPRELSCGVTRTGGRRMILNFRLYPVMDEKGKVTELKGIARDITHAKNLEFELRKKVNEIQMQWEVGRTVSSTMNVDIILKHGLEVLCRMFHYPACSVYLLDEKKTGLYPRISKGLRSGLSKSKIALYGEGVVGRVAKEKKILLVPDMAKHPEYMNGRRNVKSEMAVPLLAGRKLVGVLDLGSPKRDAFGKEDIIRLSLFSSQLASAISNARLLEELRGANEELNRTNLLLDFRAMELGIAQRILEGISEKLEPESILGAISDPLREILPLGSLALFLIGSRRNILLVNSNGSSSPRSTKMILHDLMKELTKTKLVGREMLERPIEEHVFGRSSAKRISQNPETTLCFPLSGEKGVFGAIYLTQGEGKKFTDEEGTFLCNVTSQISLGLSRLFSIREYQDRMEEISRMKADFSSLISHELRTPITSLNNSIDLLLSDKLGDSNPKQYRFLQLAKKDISRLAGMINNVLELSRLESGSSTINRKELEIRRAFDIAIDRINGLSEERDVAIVKKVSRSLPKLFADPDKLEQIIINLLTNAIKFSQRGQKVQINASLVTQLSRRLPKNRKLPPGWRSSSILQNGNGTPARVTRANSNSFIEIAVKDWGAGISREKLDTIFDKFIQEDSSMTRVVSGAGLGLTITKHFTAAHDGLLWAESRSGEGSVFRCLLPVCSDDVLTVGEHAAVPD